MIETSYCFTLSMSVNVSILDFGHSNSCVVVSYYFISWFVSDMWYGISFHILTCYLHMVYNYTLLDLICQYFLRIFFCLCSQEILGCSFLCNVCIWLWFYNGVDLTEWVTEKNRKKREKDKKRKKEKYFYASIFGKDCRKLGIMSSLYIW